MTPPTYRVLRYRTARLTAQSATTETTLTGLPAQGILRRVRVVKVSGTATTFDPVIGRVTNPSGKIGQIWANGTPAAPIEANDLNIPFATDSGTLYMRVVCDAGSDTVCDYEVWVEVTR